MNSQPENRYRILYVMHVDWHWIKQRPQFLAEELSRYFDVLVAHPIQNRRSRLVASKTDVCRVPIPQLPFGRFKFIATLNELIRSLVFRLLAVLRRPEVVWLAHPSIVSIPSLNKLGKALVVYDCMDDAAEFMAEPTLRATMSMRERELLKRVDIVFVSSQNLREKILGRGFGPCGLELVRNAFGGRELDFCPIVKPPGDKFRILYFGTISNWIHFDVVLRCLESHAELEFHFVGPLEVTVPAHSRLVFHGPVEHSRLVALTEPYDCFIMPFETNELIKAVDPVKLYEYINLGKNILCPYYEEVERFADFVFFYKNCDELIALIRNLQVDNRVKYGGEQRKSFLRNNSWKARAQVISRVIADQMSEH
jgi:teichuronic acid biosynthesis glycosyltransferase TuaH